MPRARPALQTRRPGWARVGSATGIETLLRWEPGRRPGTTNSSPRIQTGSGHPRRMWRRRTEPVSQMVRLTGRRTCLRVQAVIASRPATMGAVGHEASRIEVQREVVLRTPRLTLTPWLVDDVESLHEVHSDPETMEFVRYGRPESRSEVEQLVDRYIAEHAARGWTKWRLADLDDQLVGRAGFGGTSESRGLS